MVKILQDNLKLVQAKLLLLYCLYLKNQNQIEDELNTIVDLGGIVDDVFVNHEVYGNLKVELEINSRRKVQELIKGIKSGESVPLKNLTSGKHFHTVHSDSEEVLELIEKELKEKGYLNR